MDFDLSGPLRAGRRVLVGGGRAGRLGGPNPLRRRNARAPLPAPPSSGEARSRVWRGADAADNVPAARTALPGCAQVDHGRSAVVGRSRRGLAQGSAGRTLADCEGAPPCRPRGPGSAEGLGRSRSQARPPPLPAALQHPAPLLILRPLTTRRGEPLTTLAGSWPSNTSSTSM